MNSDAFRVTCADVGGGPACAGKVQCQRGTPSAQNRSCPDAERGQRHLRTLDAHSRLVAGRVRPFTCAKQKLCLNPLAERLLRWPVVNAVNFLGVHRQCEMCDAHQVHRLAQGRPGPAEWPCPGSVPTAGIECMQPTHGDPCSCTRPTPTIPPRALHPPAHSFSCHSTLSPDELQAAEMLVAFTPSTKGMDGLCAHELRPPAEAPGFGPGPG